jgi:hypothetical protein
LGDTQVLLAEREDGARLPVDALSEGTADALYLALRLAAIDVRGRGDSAGSRRMACHRQFVRSQDAHARTLELSPDSVTVYQMEVPYNTGIYRQMKVEGKLVAPVADWDTKRRWVDWAFNRFGERGYRVSSGYTLVRDPARVHFKYRDMLWEGADLVALGVASFGHLSGMHYQNEPHWEPYLGAVEAGHLPEGDLPRDERPRARRRMLRNLHPPTRRCLISAPSAWSPCSRPSPSPPAPKGARPTDTTRMSAWARCSIRSPGARQPSYRSPCWPPPRAVAPCTSSASAPTTNPRC